MSRPADSDPRFTFGLVIEVAETLRRHGFPAVAAGADLVRLQQALFGFVYTSPEV